VTAEIERTIAVIGGGPSGMTAAIRASEAGARVVLLERNEKLGKKLYITGKGRCNVTNTADAERTQAHIMRGAAFMRSPLAAFDYRALREWLESLGVPTVEERGGRVFPASMKASDVTRALSRELDRLGVDVRLNARVVSVDREADAIAGVTLSIGGRIRCSTVIISTGGMSYPLTGSTGDGYGFAEALGHRVMPPRPALTPLTSDERWVHALQGLTLRNVTLAAQWRDKRFYEEQGELLFTHFGLSGPLALTLSSRIPDGAAWSDTRVFIDLKPGMTPEEVESRLVRELAENPRRQLATLLTGWAPERLARELPERCGVASETMAARVTRGDRLRLARTIKALPVGVCGTRGFDEAVVTRGGVDLKEADPKTMASKLVRGLYFAGEVLDIDALTGGFNLQAAFATGNQAGRAAARFSSAVR
jgi:predicted Rossmann fold flavoprotein